MKKFLPAAANRNSLFEGLGHSLTEISVPRDRKGTFEPQIIEKRQTRTDDIEARVLAMYAKGMSTRDIEDHLRDIYRVKASASLISRITDSSKHDVHFSC